MRYPELMDSYSGFSLFGHSLSKHRNWNRAWRMPEIRPYYDAIIIGAGGHGLATAYYLARSFGFKNVAVIDKSYLGGGNSGRR